MKQLGKGNDTVPLLCEFTISFFSSEAILRVLSGDTPLPGQTRLYFFTNLVIYLFLFLYSASATGINNIRQVVAQHGPFWSSLSPSGSIFSELLHKEMLMTMAAGTKKSDFPLAPFSGRVLILQSIII